LVEGDAQEKLRGSRGLAEFYARESKKLPPEKKTQTRLTHWWSILDDLLEAKSQRIHPNVKPNWLRPPSVKRMRLSSP